MSNVNPDTVTTHVTPYRINGAERKLLANRLEQWGDLSRAPATALELTMLHNPSPVILPNFTLYLLGGLRLSLGPFHGNIPLSLGGRRLTRHAVRLLVASAD
jgi:hypothetical protein